MRTPLQLLGLGMARLLNRSYLKWYMPRTYFCLKDLAVRWLNPETRP